MLTFQIDDKQIQIEREGLEARLQEAVIARLDESKDVAPMLRSALKMVADMIIPMVGVKVPKGEDKLAFLTAFIMKVALDYMEGATLPVEGKVINVQEDPKEEGGALAD